MSGGRSANISGDFLAMNNKCITSAASLPTLCGQLISLQTLNGYVFTLHLSSSTAASLCVRSEQLGMLVKELKITFPRSQYSSSRCFP